MRRLGNRVKFWFSTGVRVLGGMAMLWTSSVKANPVGEQVVGGAATFNRPDAATLIVNQQTDRAVINWNNFSIANGELTRFVQPSSTSAALNRVVTLTPSLIDGALQANGQVWLSNPNGIMVGKGGTVNVGSFVASTHDIQTDDFMRGGEQTFRGNSDATILNQGNVQAQDGDVFLIAKEVKNEGQLMARDGTVGMVSGTEVSLQAVGQGNYKIRLLAAENAGSSAGGGRSEARGEAEIVNEGVIQAANAVLEAKGSYLPMAIKNTGVIEATGVRENGDGTVRLIGGEGDILNTGVVAALQRSLDGQKETGGSILMAGKNVTSDPGSVITAWGRDGGGTIKLRAGDTTILRGEISVVGGAENAKGGQVQLLGERVGLLESAKVDASGGAGGGEVLVGGDYLGRNPEVPNAKATVMGPEAKIFADATASGDGGRVIIWSDDYSGFYGDILARGVTYGGHGGFVETSSKNNLQAFGNVDASAPNGKGGVWLLDPANVNIAAGPSSNGSFNSLSPNVFSPNNLGSATASATTIENSLNSGTSVTILTGPSTASDLGNITMSTGISKTAGADATLTMIAAGSINISQSIVSSSGGLSLVLGAYSSVTIGAAVTTLGGDITIQGATIVGNALATSAVEVVFGSGANISTQGGSGPGNLSVAAGGIFLDPNAKLNIQGTVTASGAFETIYDSGDITIGDITLPGADLTITAGGSIIINGDINVTTGTLIMSAGNSLSNINGIISSAGTPTITAANFAASGWSVGIPAKAILINGGAPDGSLTFSALASGFISNASGSTATGNSGVFLRKLNSGGLNVGTVGNYDGIGSSGSGGVILVNEGLVGGDITVGARISSFGGPIYLSSQGGGIAINSIVQSFTPLSDLSVLATVGLYGGGNYTGETSAIIDDNSYGLISTERLGLATPGFQVTMDSALHQITQIAADTGIGAAPEADFTFSGASYYLGVASYFDPVGTLPAVPTNLSGVRGRSVNLTSSGDITPPGSLVSTPVISVGLPAGTIGIDVLTTRGGSIRLDSPSNTAGTASVRLRSLDGGLLGFGDITYRQATGYDLAGLQTGGVATLQFGGDLTQSTAAIQVGTLALSGTGNVNFGTLNNQIGVVQGGITGDLTLLDTTTTLFAGLVIGTSLTQGLSSTGTVTITTTGDLTQDGPLSAANLIATANLGSITLELASGGVSVNAIDQLSMLSTGAGNSAIYRDIDSYTVNQAVAPNVVSLGADGGLVQDNATFDPALDVFTAATTVLNGTYLEFVGRNGANFDLQNSSTYSFERFAATGNDGLSNFFYRDTDWLIISSVRDTTGVVSGTATGGRGNFMITAGGDITQDAPILVNNLRAMIRDPLGGGRFLVLSQAGNDVNNVSLQIMDNAGGDNPDPTVTIPGNANQANNPENGRIYFRDTNGFVVGVNQAVGEVVTTEVTTGVVTAKGTDSNVVLQSGVLDGVTQRYDPTDANPYGTAVYTSGLGLLGGDFRLDQGVAVIPGGAVTPDSRNDVDFFSVQTLDNDIFFREFNGYTVNFVRMDFPIRFQGGLSQADFQVNGIQAGDVILQVQAPTQYDQGLQGIWLNFTGTRFGGNGQTLLSDFSTTDMTFDSPGYIESSGRVIVTIGNSNALIPDQPGATTTATGRFTMDQGIHIITTVAGGSPPAHTTLNQGNRDIAIFADNMVLGGDSNSGITVTGLIQTPDVKTPTNPMETVTLAPFSNDRQLFVASPKATLGDTSYFTSLLTTTQVNPNQLELSGGELRRINTDRLIIRSNYTDLVKETPAVDVRSPINLYGLYDNTFASQGVFPNNAGVNRLQIQAAGQVLDPLTQLPLTGVYSRSYAWVESEISSDINQLPLQIFVVSANNPYTTPDSGAPVFNQATQGDRVVVGGGIRSYGGTVILRGQDATITAAINATSKGLVGIVPAADFTQTGALVPTSREITLGSEPGDTLSVLRSELGLITAGTIQIGSLNSASMPNGLGNNPFYVNPYETVNAGKITITDLMSGLSADTLALVTDGGVDEQQEGGIVAPGLALVGGFTASGPLDNRDFLLDSANNDVDRLAVYMADAGLSIAGDPVQNVVYHDQNGFGGGNGFEVALVQQQAEQGVLRSTATAGNILVSSGLGLIRANQLSITAGGDVTVYDVIPAGGPTSTAYIGHVPRVPGNAVLVLGNLVNLLAIDASTPSPETGGVNEVFFSAANGLGVGDLENLRGGVAGIQTNGGNVTLEANEMDIQAVIRTAGGDDITIDTTSNGIAPDGARVVLRPATGFNGFVNRAGAGAPVEIEIGGDYATPTNGVVEEGLDGVLDLAQVEVGATRIRSSVLEIGSRSNPATASGKISIVPTTSGPFTGLAFSSLTQVLHLLTGGAIEDVRATTGTLNTGITINSLAAEANGSISLIGALNSIGSFAAETNFGQSEVRLFNNRDMVLGTVDGVSGILASTFAAQLSAGGVNQTPGSSIEAGLLSINTSAGGGNVTLNSENGVAQVAINAGTGNILLRTTGNTRIVSAAASQPGGSPVAVSGLTGTLITLYSGGDVSQDANAPITRGGATTPTAVTVVTQNGFSITLNASGNRLPSRSVFAAVTSSGDLGSLTNLTLVNGVNGGGLELGSGALIDLSLSNAGSGYTGTGVPLSVTIASPTGLGGNQALGQVVAGIKTIKVQSGGAGYLSAPKVTIGGTGGAAAVAIIDTNPLSATYGQVTSIQIVDPGTGYLSLPTVTLSGGSPAQAATVAASELQITGLVITDPGSRYAAIPQVTIRGGGGSGATGAAMIGGTGGVYFSGGSAVSGGITGNLNIQNRSLGAGISQQTTGTAGAIAVAGTTSLVDASTAGISLGNNYNNLQGTITVTQSGGGSVALGNKNSAVLGNISQTGGSLTVTSTGGSIYQFNNANVIRVPGAASFFATANGQANGIPVGSVILNNALNAFGGVVSAAGTRVVIRDSLGDLQLGNVVATTSLTALATAATGNITQAPGTSLGSASYKTGPAVFAVGAGQSILLGNANYFGSSIAFNSINSAPLLNITVRNVGDLTLPTLILGGSLQATVDTGTLTLANLTTSGGSATYNGAAVLATATTITTTGGITFNNTLNGSQNLILNAGTGAVTLNGAVGGTTRLGGITLGSAGTVTAQAITAASLQIPSGAKVTTLNFNGAQNYNTAPGLFAVADVINLNNTVTTTGGGIVTLIADSGALTITSAGDIVAAGAVTLSGATAIYTAGDVTTSGATVSFSGVVNQTGTVSIDTTQGGSSPAGAGVTFNDQVLGNQSLNLTVGRGDIWIGSGSDLGTLSVVSGNSLTVSNTGGDLALGPVLLSGNLNVTTGGNLSSAGAVVVGGDTVLNAGANAITLDNRANAFRGTVRVNSGLSSLTLTDTTALDLGVISGSVLSLGAINLTANGITQSADLNITGPATFNGGSGAVNLTDAQNRYGGRLTVAGGSVRLFVNDLDQASLKAGSVTTQGSFELTTGTGVSFGLLGGAGAFALSLADLQKFSAGTFNPVAQGIGGINVGPGTPVDWNLPSLRNLTLTTTGTGSIDVNNVRFITGNLSMVSGGQIAGVEDRVHLVSGLGPIRIGASSGNFDFANGRGLNLNGTVVIPGRLSLEVAGQFYNLTGLERPLAKVGGGSVIKSLSLMGGLPNLISSLSGFSYRFDGAMPTTGNVMSYAVSPLAMYAPAGTTIAGVDLGGTQTGGGQLNTFITGSDNLNWMISDFGKFNLPKVEPARMEYMLYPQRVEPETRSLPQPVMRELTQELGRPPTLEELQKREIATRAAAKLRSGAILERNSFDDDQPVAPQQEAKAQSPVFDGGKPQAKVQPNQAGGLAPQAANQVDTKRDPNGPMLRGGLKRAVVMLRPEEKGVEEVKVEGTSQASAKQIIEQERANAEVGIAPPIAAGK